MLAAAARRPGSRARCMTGCALPHLKAEGGVRSAGSRGSLWSGDPLPPTGRGLALAQYRDRRCSGEGCGKRSPLGSSLRGRSIAMTRDLRAPIIPRHLIIHSVASSGPGSSDIHPPPSRASRRQSPSRRQSVGPHRYKHVGVCVSDAHATTLPHRVAPCSAAPSANGFPRVIMVGAPGSTDAGDHTAGGPIRRRYSAGRSCEADGVSRSPRGSGARPCPRTCVAAREVPVLYRPSSHSALLRASINHGYGREYSSLGKTVGPSQTSGSKRGMPGRNPAQVPHGGWRVVRLPVCKGEM